MKCAILLTAYGTGSLSGRKCLHSFDECVRKRFPGVSVRWAYTSLLLRERLAKARQKSDSVLKALNRLCYEQFNVIAVQPLQTIAGQEHHDIRQLARLIEVEKSVSVSVGSPLLANKKDIQRVALALVQNLPPERKLCEDVVFMGHGSKHHACEQYALLEVALQNLDANIHVCTLNDTLSLERLLPTFTSKQIWLIPLLSVVGRHTLIDMAGSGKDSCRSRIEAAGYQCLPILKGTVEYSAVAEIWLEHLHLATKHFAGI